MKMLTLAILLLSLTPATVFADSSSGLPTGKRQHKPVAITQDIDKTSPQLRMTTTTQTDKSTPKLQEAIANGTNQSDAGDTETMGSSTSGGGGGAGKVKFDR